MTRIAFFEPRYAARNARDWEIRGSYKYPSLLRDLHKRADVMLLMSELPPENDQHRMRLEQEFGVTFQRIDTLDDQREVAADALMSDYLNAIAEHDPDIISTLNGRMIGYNFALARAARASGIEFVYRIAGNDIATRTAVFEKRGRPVSETSFEGNLIAQERYAAHVARTVIVMGGTEKKRAEAFVADTEKIRICRRGVDQDHFSPGGGLGEKCGRFLFLGRNSEEKGIDLLEAASERVAKNHPEIRFTIAGDFEPHVQGNREYRGFHGYDALPELYREHDALILPARSEGFPQVVMEAMSCGLPAILSKHLFEDDFDAGQGAVLVPLDARKLADSVLAMHTDTDFFANMRGAALDHAKAEFDASLNGAAYHSSLLDKAA